MRALYRHFAGALACLSLLAGCTGLMHKIDSDAQSDNARATQLLNQSEAGDNRASDPDAVVVKDQLWLSGKTLKIATKATLPAVFDEPASFDGTVDSLRTFADRVSRLVHVPVKVMPSADDAAERASEAANPSSAMSTGTPGTPPLPTGLLQGPTLQQLAAAGRNNAAQAAPRPVRIVYSGGTLHGLLDAAAARFNVYWKYEDGAIVFFYTETRVFQVLAVPGDSSVATNVVSGSSNNGGQSGGTSSGGSSGGTSTASGGSGSTPTVSSNNNDNIAMNAQLSVYSSLQSAIKAMLSQAGSVILSPATGSISVTDTPDVLEHVAEFMEQQNRVLSRQVLVNVTVLSVTLTDEDSYGINWNAVYQALGTKFGISTSFTSLITNPNSFSATVISPSSRANTTNAMIAALSTQGSVRQKTSASLTTMNDQPVPVQVAEEESYLAQISTTNTLNVGTETSLTPGTVTTGLNLTLLPHVLDDGTVMMQFYTNISSLVSLNTFTSNGEEIQLPTVDTRNFLQRISVKSGQTLVISGYEGIADQGSRQGVGSPTNYVLGGGVSGTHQKEIIVILLSPIVLNGA
jgi:type IVB pilus formation R64 PilN family outer membrane protein